MSSSNLYFKRFQAIYDTNDDRWTVPILDRFLLKEYETILHDYSAADDCSATTLRVFVPLCGKTPDLLWLASKGHKVVGVEWLESVVKEFFENSNIPYTVTTVDISGDTTIPLYTSNDQHISIFAGDYFMFKSQQALDHLGQFDFIWDNGSIGSFPPEQRVDYVSIMSPLLGNNGKMILVTFDYDHSEHPSIPFAVVQSEVMELYGSGFDVQLIGTMDADSLRDVYKNTSNIIKFQDLKNFSWKFYLLAKK